MEFEEAVSHARRIVDLTAAEPDRVGYVAVSRDGSEQSCSWGWMHRRSSQLAGALADRGLAQGDHMAISLRNSPEFVLAAFAAWKLGAVPVPVRWDLPTWELERVLAVIEPQVHLAADDLPWIAATESAPVPELPGAVSPHVQGICSSGSTGTPKVILAGAASVCGAHYAKPLGSMWRPIPRPQTIMVLAPMYHVNAFATLYNMLAGDRLVVLEAFDASLALDVIERHRISTFTATPTMLQRMAAVDDVDRRDLSSIEWMLQGAAPMPPSLADHWIGLVGADRLVMAYGATEGVGTTAIRGDEWLTHRGSVGRGLRGTEVRVLGPDLDDLPPGEVGEVYMRLPTGTGFGGYRYLGEAEPSRGTDDGFHTVGDLGYLDDEGFLYLVDRRSDLIVSGGANVFPAEVEVALRRPPGDPRRGGHRTA